MPLKSLQISEHHFYFNIWIQIPKDPTASSSCHSVRISFALWRHRKDSQIPASTWHYGFPVTITWPRSRTTWKNSKTICTMTFKGVAFFTEVILPLHISLYLDFLTWTVVSYVFSYVRSLSNSQPAVGLMALFSLALKSSCYDLNTVTFTVGENSATLLTHLKKQMDQEKDHTISKLFFDLFMANGCHKKCTSSCFTLRYKMSSKFIQCRQFFRKVIQGKKIRV